MTTDTPLGPSAEVFKRGSLDFVQDYYENCPFASIGGLDKRDALKAPEYIVPEHADEYLAGYVAAARDILGADWQTCAFGWAPAPTIGGEP